MTAATAWELDREHEEFRASVRAFVDRHVRPVVDESERSGRPPAALLKEMGAAGLLGLAIGEEDGGGGDSLAMMVLSEELARASGGIAVPVKGGGEVGGGNTGSTVPRCSSPTPGSPASSWWPPAPRRTGTGASPRSSSRPGTPGLSPGTGPGPGPAPASGAGRAALGQHAADHPYTLKNSGKACGPPRAIA